MKKTIIQCVTAVICVIALALSSTTAIGKLAEAKVKTAEAEAKSPSAVVNTDDGNGGSAAVDPTTGDDGSATADPATGDDGSATADPAADDTTAGDSSSTGDTTGTAAGGATGGAAATGSNAPSSKADIIKYYNTAVNKAISSKAGYTKTRHTDLGQLEGADAIMKFQVAADAVNSFLGVGDTKYVNKKGEAKYLSQAALTEADVKDAKCVPNGDIYTITLTLADGKSVANDSTKTDNSPLKRSGLFVGNDDKSEYDYKSAVNIYVGLKNSEDTDIGAVEETTSKTTITIKVNSKTGNIQSYNASWHWDANLTDVKYLFVKISGIGHADSSVAISGFQF